MLLKCGTILTLLTAFSVSALAQEESFWKKREEEVTSPVNTDAKPWLIYGTLATLVFAFPLEDAIVDPLQEETVENKPLGKFSIVGDLSGQGIPNAIYALGMGANYWMTGDTKSHHHMKVMFAASTYAIGTAWLLKDIVREPRPNDGHDKSSFPSGHTTAAFAFSSAVVAEHGMWPWGILATSLASLTAFSRINDNRHYLHDVIGGFTIGTAYGFGISSVYAKRSKTESFSQNSDWRLLPYSTREGSGLTAVLNF